MSDSNDLIRKAKSEILTALRISGKPISMEYVTDKLTNAHWQALDELLKDDRIASAGIRKWEIL